MGDTVKPDVKQYKDIQLDSIKDIAAFIYFFHHEMNSSCMH